MAFATVYDVEQRWRVLDEAEKWRCEALIGDASAMLKRLVDVREGDADQAALLLATCCNMVIRAMSASQSDGFGLSQQTMTAGPYSQSFSYSNPSGDLYLTRMEKRALGIGAAIGTIPPRIGGCDD